MLRIIHDENEMLGDRPVCHLAREVMDLLENRGAVRTPDDDPRAIYKGPYVTKFEICEQLNLAAATEWQPLRQWMENNGYQICWTNGKGFYIGTEGEGIKNTQMKYWMAEGWASKMPTWQRQLESASPEQKYWLQVHQQQRDDRKFGKKNQKGRE